jgi:Flp pilus assembly protein TadB
VWPGVTINDEKLVSRVGETAAGEFTAARQARRSSQLWISCTAVVALTGIALHSSGAWIAVIPAAIAGWYSLRMSIHRHRYYTNASDELGVNVSTFNDVPPGDAAYEAWCRKNGVAAR